MLATAIYEQVGLAAAGLAATVMNNSAGTNDPVALLAQYGVLGVVVIGFAVGWIVPGPQAKALAEENRRLTAVVEGKLFPMLENYGATLDRAAQALDKSAEALEKSSLALDRFTQRERS